MDRRFRVGEVFMAEVDNGKGSGIYPVISSLEGYRAFIGEVNIEIFPDRMKQGAYITRNLAQYHMHGNGD